MIRQAFYKIKSLVHVWILYRGFGFFLRGEVSYMYEHVRIRLKVLYAIAILTKVMNVSYSRVYIYM